MTCRMPVSRDFPSHVSLSIIPPPHSQKPTNVLVLLHGLGDTKESFARLAENLAIPETACIALQGPTPLPFDLGGFHWGDDVIFDQVTGDMDFDTGFRKAEKYLAKELIKDVLISKCGYDPRSLMCLGFGQGGMAALAAATIFTGRADALGGVISIGGPLPSGYKITRSETLESPILVLGGSGKTLLNGQALTALKDTFRDVEVVKWAKSGDTMPKNREEMLPIMRFLARRLRSTAGVPANAVELTR
ncbi:MAG: hypothetical protein M1825_001781 [Sarcosagium campestre]|nr:MAG: hypothetical protein M1825_001781 [Sarcosagium campestre]